MNCFACRSPVDVGAKFCPNCGTALQQPVCSRCGGKYRHGDVFCADCGQALPTAAITNTFPGLTPSPDDHDNERKFVTILRADLVRSTDLIAALEPEDAVLRLEPALAAMRAAVRHFGGIVSRETGDGLSAVFGAPLANDNHAPLACHAAIELARRVAALDDPEIQVRVGLHSGLVVTYIVASEFSKVFELGGAAQHLAARLEGVADAGEIYASEACKTLSEGHIRFEYLGPKMLKGFTNPIPVYRVVSASDISSWQVRKTRNASRFVGRSAEISRLRQAAAETAEHGRLIYVVGDPGIGKSRLLHELVQELESNGWNLIQAECSPTLQASPFAVLKSLLLSMRGRIRERAQEGADEWGGLPEILRAAVDTVLGLAVSNPQWDELTPDLRSRAICEAFRALIEILAHRERTILLIEDVHWLDSASSSAIGSLNGLTLPSHLLALATSRPNAAPDWLAKAGSEKLLVRPLDLDSGRAMLDEILGSSASTADLKTRVIDHTGNVPLFIEEVCRRLKETGVLCGQWGRMTVSTLPEELGIPPHVQGVIAARIDRLPKDERRLLQIAAAIGARAALATLRGVAALPESLLQRRLALLDAAELLIEADVSDEPSYRFPHELVRQVTYDSMLELTRRRLHQRVLSTLEAFSSEGSSDQSDVLCHHASRAKDWPKTFSYGRAVARKCVATSAFANATSYFDLAMNALDKTPISRERESQAVDLRIEARMAFSGFGQTDRWLQLGKEAEQRADAIGDAERKVTAMAVRSAALNFYGAPLEAIAAGEEVVRHAERLGDPAWLNFAEYGLGQAYFIAGRCRDAERILARPYARMMGPNPKAPIGITVRSQLLIYCMMKSAAHTMLGEFETAESFSDQAQKIANGSSRPFDRIGAAYSAGILLLGRGDLTAAATLLADAVALANKHEVRLFIPIITCLLGTAYLEQGRIDAARETLAQAHESAEAIGHTSARLRASIYSALALALSERPDADRALSMLQAARDIARQQGFEGLEAEALFASARATRLLTPDDVTTVDRNLRASIAIATRNEARPFLAKLEAFAEVLHRGGGAAASPATRFESQSI